MQVYRSHSDKSVKQLQQELQAIEQQLTLGQVGAKRLLLLLIVRRAHCASDLGLAACVVDPLYACCSFIALLTAHQL